MSFFSGITSLVNSWWVALLTIKWTSWKKNYMVRRERKLRLTMPMAATIVL